MNLSEHKAYLKVGFFSSCLIALFLIPLRLLTVENSTIAGEWKCYLLWLSAGTLSLWALLEAGGWFERKYCDHIEIYRPEDLDISEMQKQPVFYSNTTLFNIFAISELLWRLMLPSAVVMVVLLYAVPKIDNPWFVLSLGLVLFVSLASITVAVLAVFPWFYATIRIRCAKCEDRIIGAKIRPRPEYRSSKPRSAVARYFWPDQIAERKFTCPNCGALNVVVNRVS
jgi:hypothetical protein